MGLKPMAQVNRYLEKAIGHFNDIMSGTASDWKLFFAD
jgi:hypothetical protein